MPSAFHATREFARRSLAEIRSGQGDSAPHQHVEPFGAGQASTGAALLKLATTASNARRDRAAAQRDLADKDLARELVRAQIAEIRARTTAAGQPTPAKTGPVTGMDFTIGGKVYPKGSSAGDVNRARGLANDAERRNVEGRRSAAVSGMAEIDQRIDREAESHAAVAMRKLDPYIAALTGPNAKLREHSLSVFRKLYGLDLSAYAPAKTGKGDDEYEQLIPTDVIARQQAARKELADSLKGQAARILEGRYGGQRRGFQQILNEMATRPAPSDVGESDSSDPEGLFAPEGP